MCDVQDMKKTLIYRFSSGANRGGTWADHFPAKEKGVVIEDVRIRYTEEGQIDYVDIFYHDKE